MYAQLLPVNSADSDPATWRLYIYFQEKALNPCLSVSLTGASDGPILHVNGDGSPFRLRVCNVREWDVPATARFLEEHYGEMYTEEYLWKFRDSLLSPPSDIDDIFYISTDDKGVLAHSLAEDRSLGYFHHADGNIYVLYSFGWFLY